jgi:hypothetical protein
MYDYSMDPSGNVVFTLKNPNAPLAIWGGESDPIIEPAIPTNNEPFAEDEPPPAQGDKASLPDDSRSITPSDGPVTFLVSSRHLILASPVLKAMLTGGWNEGSTNNGQFQIRAEDWNVEALEVVMNVLHSQYRKVPKRVTLEMLAKIAVIVDYYKVHEAFQIVALTWLRPFSKWLPNLLSPDIILLILVSWVFEHAIIFKHVTKIAILRSRKDVSVSQQLPIPSAVIGKLL